MPTQETAPIKLDPEIGFSSNFISNNLKHVAYLLPFLLLLIATFLPWLNVKGIGVVNFFYLLNVNFASYLFLAAVILIPAVKIISWKGYLPFYCKFFNFIESFACGVMFEFVIFIGGLGEIQLGLGLSVILTSIILIYQAYDKLL